MLKEYKIFAGNMIVESDNTKELKIQLLNFVKEGTEPQVKNFILNGTVIENINEASKNLINEQFEKVYVEIEGPAVAGAIALTGMLSAQAWVAWRLLSAVFNKAKAKCGALSVGSQRKMCIAAVIANDQKKRIAFLQKEIKNCKANKNPEKCVSKIKNTISKAQNKLNKQQAILKKGAMKGKDATGAVDAVKRHDQRRVQQNV